MNFLPIDRGAFARFKPTMIDLLPPPFFHVEMNLIEKKSKDGKLFGFNTLSSGEKQMIFTIGSLLYHLKNVDSVKARNDDDDVYYEHINVILEEIELYYHPNMQRNMLNYILNCIQKLEISTRSIQILLITHSPFILSDIPLNNVLYLKDGECCNKDQTESFGANIFELLKDNFYLDDGPIGVHSYKTLTEMFKLLSQKKIGAKNLKRIIEMKEHVGEPFLKNELERLIEFRNKDI